MGKVPVAGYMNIGRAAMGVLKKMGALSQVGGVFLRHTLVCPPLFRVLLFYSEPYDVGDENVESHTFYTSLQV